ncbi:MAG: PEP-CTERM sorting domain-containing protein [Akkermansia sp.]|nr:PEP-CTERM sorting domain-containing protein [Akkermansia sp.]
MKKRLILFLAVSGLAMGESITLHGVTFTTPSTLGGFHKNTNYSTGNFVIDGAAYGNLGNNPTVGGLYITDGSSFRVNGSNNNIVLTYLYMESDDAVISDYWSGGNTGTIGWGNSTSAKIQIKDNGWLDINTSLSRVDVSKMVNGGSIYLNTNGSLTLSKAIDTDVTVYATITDSATERTLISANFEGWTGNVVLLDEQGNVYKSGNYDWEATSAGLMIVSIPEPTTATLSLLALAGLAARRRRK